MPDRCCTIMSLHIVLRSCVLLLSVAVAGCRESSNSNAVSDGNEVNLHAADAQASAQPDPIQSHAASSTAATDPKSAAAAREVVLRYARLVEDGRMSEARPLWTEGSDTSAIEAQLEKFEQLDAKVGNPGQLEGAAGSSYVDVPLQLAGRTGRGEPLGLDGTVTLRRVNDVPGSTELQRRWHIYRIELQPRP